MKKLMIRGLTIGLVGLLGIAPALADSCGIERPIKTIVGYGAGGGTDSYARILASTIPEFLDEQPIVIINKPGGAQVAAMKQVKAAAADGYTLQVVAMGGGLMSTMLRDQGINWLEDFEPIAQFGITNQSLVVRQEDPIENTADLVAHIKSEFEAGKKTRWSHPGRGSVSHVGVTAFLAKNDILEMTQDVPFQGGAETRNALVSGEVTFSVSGAHTVPAFSDILLGIGLFAEERDPVVDNIPTLKEQGFDFVPTFSPIVLAAPKGVSAEFVNCVSAAVGQATQHKSFTNLAKKAGQAVVYTDAATTKAMLEALVVQWKPTIDEVRKQLGQ